jgi:PKD repeat protein
MRNLNLTTLIRFLLGAIIFTLTVSRVSAQACTAGFSSSVNAPIKTVTFTNTSTTGGAGLIYYWNFGDGNYSSLTSPSHVYTHNGIYVVSLTATRPDSSCYSYYSDTIQVGAPCEADFYYTINSSNARKYYFHNTSSGSGPVYSWDFGDGTYSSLSNPTHTFAADGVYAVMLTMHNGDSSCFDGKIVYITVSALPCNVVADFSFSHDSDTYNWVSFQSLSSGSNLKVYWSFGDGTGNPGHSAPDHIYPGPGTYTVCLTAVNLIDTACSDMICETVTIATPCSAEFSYNTDSMNTSSNIYYFNSWYNQAGLTYYWNFGDGYYSSLPDPTHQYTADSTYTVCLTISNPADSCYDYQCKTITVGHQYDSVCHAEFNYFLDTLTGIFHFNNLSSGGFGAQYYWNFGDGSTSTLFNPLRQYTGNGFYVVSLSMISADSSCQDLFWDTIIVQNNPIDTNLCNASFTYWFDSLGYVHFNNTSTTSGPPAYWWIFTDQNGSIATGSTNGMILFPANGYMVACLTVRSTTDSGCFSTICDTIFTAVNGNTMCHADFTYWIDPSGYAHFNNTSTTNGSPVYLWTITSTTGAVSSTNTKNLLVQFSGGTYEVVCLTVRSTIDSSCYSTICDTIFIPGNNDTMCYAEFYFANYTYNNGSIQFYNTSIGSNLTYLWSFGLGTSTLANPLFYFPTAGTYMVTLTITNTITGCSSTIIKPVTVTAITTCHADFTYTYDASTHTYHFINLSTGPDSMSFLWDFGYGATSNLENPSWAFVYPGVRHVTLILMSPNCWDSIGIDLYITANPGCDASFNVYPDSMNQHTVFFSPVNVDPLATYTWNFGDGTSTIGQGLTHTYSSDGFYIACLTVNNWNDSCIATHCDTLLIGSPTGIQEQQTTSFSNVYPIPFTDEITLEVSSPGTAKAKLIIMDIAGKTLQVKDITLHKDRNALAFDVKELPRGTYFITLDSEYGHSVKKICK